MSEFYEVENSEGDGAWSEELSCNATKLVDFYCEVFCIFLYKCMLIICIRTIELIYTFFQNQKKLKF